MKPYINCKHNGSKDFSTWDMVEQERIQHLYCQTCKSHVFIGKFYTLKEWEAYING